MKKGVVILFSALILSVFLIGIISAAIPDVSSQIEDGLSNIAKNVEPIVKWLLGPVTAVQGPSIDMTEGELLVVKLLLFLIMMGVVYFAVGKIPGLNNNTGLVWLVTTVISLLATRFLTTAALVNLVWLPSGAVGIALTALFPFVIYFFFVESFESRIIRRVGWIFFCVLFIALALIRWDDLAGQSGWNYGWIYIITAAISLLSFVFDKTIHAKFIMAAIEEKGAELDALSITALQTEIKNYKAIIANTSALPAAVAAAKKGIKDAEDRIRKILKH